MTTQYNDNDIFADKVGYDPQQGDNEAWYDNARLPYDANDVATIPNLFDVTDLTAIEAWQAPVTEQTDVSLLPNDVYMYGPDVAFCVVWDGKLESRDLPAGPAYQRFAELSAAALDSIPF